MELFDKRFVRFMWDDELEGKEVFVADNINSLIEHVEKGASIYKVCWSRDNGMPFESDDLVRYRFAYYDPNYEVKKAFNEGKKVQYQLVSGVDWDDIDSEEALECRIAEGRTFRIKPEEKMWIAYLARPKNGNCYLSACTDTHWESAQKEFGAKTKLFIGTHDEVSGWYESRQKFAEAIEAWEDGKTIQVYETLFKKWSDCAGTLEWYTDCEYRVKPECPCADGIDSKACVGCPQDSDNNEEVKMAELTFQEELERLLNRFGMDNECDTPDHILRDYLVNCLENYRIITKKNMLWHGWLGLGTVLTEEGRKKSIENALKFLKDEGIIKSWHYNGTFHVEGNEYARQRAMDFLEAKE